MRNFLFDKSASSLELIKFKGYAHQGTIKFKTELVNGVIAKKGFKIKKLVSFVSVYNPDKDVDESESEAFCERVVIVDE